jgi:hypothetical protein
MRKALLISVIVALSGCSTYSNSPLIFGQAHIVGISISGSAPEQKGEFVLGYKDADIAIVPVSVRQQNGDSTQLKATATKEHQDALSVLGQFSVDASTEVKTTTVGLGKFFATGMAAKKLADGFAAKMGALEEKPSEKTIK